MLNAFLRLNLDITFKLNCGFLVSDAVPSEVSCSGLLTKLGESNVLEEAQKKLIHQTNKEDFIIYDTVAIDTTHFEACDQAPFKEKKPKSKPKKRGRKPKAVREQWLKEQAKKKANLPIYQKNRRSIGCFLI